REGGSALDRGTGGVVGREAVETPLELACHARSMIAAVVRISGDRGKRVLRGKHELVPVGADDLSNESLTGTVREIVGRVHEVATERDEVVEDAAAFVARRAPAEFVAEGHGAEGKLR